MKILSSITLATTILTVTFAIGKLVVPMFDQGREAAGPAKNTVCPVSRGKIETTEKPIYVDYKGEKIALCCKHCLEVFRKDPARYALWLK
jgi:YHS domain-containing protein